MFEHLTVWKYSLMICEWRVLERTVNYFVLWEQRQNRNEKGVAHHVAIACKPVDNKTEQTNLLESGFANRCYLKFNGNFSA